MKKSFSFILAFVVAAMTAVSCSSDDESIQQSSLAEITDFSLTFEDLDPATVDYDLGTDISVSVPFRTSLTAVVPNIAVSENAVVSPASGEAINFVDGEPKVFTVTAEDGTQKQYTVTVTVRGEVGSGSRLATYTIADALGENSTTTYSYNDANFVEEYTKEADDWGVLTTTTYTFIYDDKNQITARKVAGTDEETVYTYEGDKIVKAVYSAEGSAVFTYDYTYNTNGDLASEKRTDHTDGDAISEITFVIENGNVIEENRYGDVYIASYDDKNNPFKNLYPSAYAAINVGIQAVNANNPISGTLADDVVSYEYNADGYPVSASYTYFDALATVDKTFTYLAE